MPTETNTATQGVGGNNFRAPRPKPGLNISSPGFFRRLRRSLGGTVAYLASWWRY